MAVAGHQHRLLRGGERDQVVVTGVGGAHRRRIIGIQRHSGGVCQPRRWTGCLRVAD